VAAAAVAEGTHAAVSVDHVLQPAVRCGCRQPVMQTALGNRTLLCKRRGTEFGKVERKVGE